MTPRVTDWTLALLVALGVVTGVLTMFSGEPGNRWVFVLHGVGGGALGLLTGWKLRRVWSRLVRPQQWDRRTSAGLSATILVVSTLVSGWVWSSGGDLYAVGFNLLNWHIALGVVLALAVGMHAWMRAKRLRQADLAGRRQFLHAASIGGVAIAAWGVQRPLAAIANWRGAGRRWTGSYEQGSFQGNAFPSTSWVADNPRPLAADTYSLEMVGLVANPLRLSLAELELGDATIATLDCTGGFYSTQRWSGARLVRLLALADPLPTASHVSVISYTGYRWSFPLSKAPELLLVTRVGDERLSHAHGAPVRLVAPGTRGFQWIKWVVRIELIAGPDSGAAASTVWSSWTAEGRGGTEPISVPVARFRLATREASTHLVADDLQR